SLRIYIEQSIAAMTGYRGGSIEDNEESLDNELYKLESSDGVLVCPCDAAAKKEEKGGFHLISDAEPQSPEAAPQSPEQAPPSLDYVHGPEYLEYLALSDNEISVEDQPLPTDASPTAVSPGCVADYKPLEEDPKEDPEEDPADYPTD
ncbi:hypothetical protein Tco_1281929, partial [Tanacetum coccineum]